MSEHGATLQNYNQELVKCLEDLKIRRKDILEVITKEEEERLALEKHIQALRDQLDKVNANLEKHKNLCSGYEKTIKDTEKGFKKILESSHILLNLAQQESTKLDHFHSPSSTDSNCLS